MKKIAAVFYSTAEQPRVLLYQENSPEEACTDLACLTFGILDSPIDRLIGGVCFEIESDKVVYLDGIVIARQLQSGGLGSALLEGFCMRMTNYGFEVMRTHYYRRNFYLKRAFQTNKRWGGLIRFLENPSNETPAL